MICNLRNLKTQMCDCVHAGVSVVSVVPGGDERALLRTVNRPEIASAKFLICFLLTSLVCVIISVCTCYREPLYLGHLCTQS